MQPQSSAAMHLVLVSIPAEGHIASVLSLANLLLAQGAASGPASSPAGPAEILTESVPGSAGARAGVGGAGGYSGTGARALRAEAQRHGSHGACPGSLRLTLFTTERGRAKALARCPCADPVTEGQQQGQEQAQGQGARAGGPRLEVVACPDPWDQVR